MANLVPSQSGMQFDLKHGDKNRLNLVKSIEDVNHDYQSECKYKYSKITERIHQVISDR